MLGAHNEAVVTANYFTAIESFRTTEMAKVLAYQESRGLDTAAPNAERLTDDKARKLTEANKKKGQEFLNRQSEREKVNAASRESMFTKQNHVKMHNRNDSGSELIIKLSRWLQACMGRFNAKVFYCQAKEAAEDAELSLAPRSLPSPQPSLAPSPETSRETSLARAVTLALSQPPARPLPCWPPAPGTRTSSMPGHPRPGPA